MEQHLSKAVIARTHAEAFQLMLYQADDGEELWFWNSRDGVTPFGTTVSGKMFRHAMRGYETRFQTKIPEEAQHVWVSYTRAQWVEMQTRKYDHYKASDNELSAEFVGRFPNLDDWLAINRFEPGSPRQVTRDQFLEETPERMVAAQQN